jgi:recombination protein RecA
VRSGAVDIIVVDSVAALTPQAEIDGDMGDSHVGLQARLMSQALRKLTGTISKSGACLIFINQIRMKIGVMFGNPETTTGGKALKFYSSVRLEVRRIETITQGTDNAIGNKVRVKVVKNKVAPPFRKVEMEIMFGKGISSSGSLLDAALKYDLVQKSGSWYSYGDERIGQGRENAKLFIEGHDEIGQALETQVREKMFAHLRPAEPSETPGGEPKAKAEPGTKDEVPATGGGSRRGAAARRDAAESGAGRDDAGDTGADVSASGSIDESVKLPDDELF